MCPENWLVRKLSGCMSNSHCLTQSEAFDKQKLMKSLITLKPKISEATELIKLTLSKHNKPCINFSGGKDSLVVMDLVRKLSPQTPCVFVNTGIEYKETVPYVRSFPNVIEVHPKMSFWDCCDKYGLPVSKSKAKRHGNACCLELKEKPLKEVYNSEQFDLTFDGLTSSESRQRMMTLKRMGSYYYNKGDKNWKCHPIHNWTVQEVWTYIYINKLSVNPIYGMGILRCGCRFCTAYKGWRNMMYLYNPNDLKVIAIKKGNNLIKRMMVID